LICLEALSCVWAISAHEENKPLVVLYGPPNPTHFLLPCSQPRARLNLVSRWGGDGLKPGGVDAVMLTFNKIKYEKGHPNWADFLQTMSAIIQNVCESHYDSGKKNDLHVPVPSLLLFCVVLGGGLIEANGNGNDDGA